jgi:AraC-like DNA-binding protein
MQSILLSEIDVQRVQHAGQIIERTMCNPLTVAELAKVVGLSEVRLKRFFKAYYGIAPYGYLLNTRMEKAKLLLREGVPNRSIATKLGYTTESNFCKAFRIACQQSPNSWKEIHASHLPNNDSELRSQQIYIDQAQIKLVAAFIEQSIYTHYTIQQLSRKFKLNEKALKAGFRKEYGMGIYAYLKHRRMQRAKEMLLAGTSLKTITEAMGYQHEANFCRAFSDIVKTTPMAWRRQHVRDTKKVS